jgi:hypothetical protein
MKYLKGEKSRDARVDQQHFPTLRMKPNAWQQMYVVA